MINHRKSLRIRMALPLHYVRLTPEETRLVQAGKGGLLLANSASTLPLELLNSAPTSRTFEQEALVLNYLQILDAKLNWLIERLGDEDTGLTGQGETLDLGGNGLCFVTAEFLPVGTMLRIKLKLSPTPFPVDLLAKVLRVEPRASSSSEGSRFSVAVQFIEIGDVQREQVIQFIFGQERQALRRRKRKSISER
jgi:hypothetical protein